MWFNQRIAEILEQDVPIDEDEAPRLPVFALAPDTKTAWVTFHDTITTDNMSRIATLFQLFEHGVGGATGLKAFEGASRIAAWHLHKARCF